MKSSIFSLPRLLITLATLLLAGRAAALGEPAFITDSPGENAVRIVEGESAASLYRDTNADSAIAIALDNLQRDIRRVTGEKPRLVTDAQNLGKQAIIVGEIGTSPLIDRLIAQGKIDASEIKGQWEGYLIRAVSNPLDGVEQALVVAGNDRRGTAYGLYTISEQIGVSPWYWWADVPVEKSENLFAKADTRITDRPAVKYRGIFLNDEAPALTGWVQEKFGDYNHEFYEHVFELLMRLKANYLWPAMWNNAFNDDDPQNMVRAHAYGIVMGTSHHEPMMRADKEWNRHGEGDWDYATNPQNLYDFWREGAERNRPYGSIYTLGMRGQEDTPMSEEQNIDLLETIVDDQREILKDVFDDRDITQVPQVWALYKEVQGYYEDGMRVPDDVTLLWADDNWGNIRRLPTPDERDRSGGAGVYYHFDYVGGPRSYRWMNVTPIAKIWEQMNLAYRYDARRIWIVNVGDLKPQEFPTEFFLRMAWDPADWPKERLEEFGQLWAEREFGPEHAAEIENLVTGYSRHNGRRKPELMGPDTYSQLHYREADRISAELIDMTEKAEAIYRELDDDYRDAFFQLVQHPVEATRTVSELYNATAKNRLYAQQGRAQADDYAQRARALFEADAALADRYHRINGGKWNHFMDQTHIGYTHWNNPPRNTMPVTYDYQPHDAADMGVAVEGSAKFWPASGDLALPQFSPYGPQDHYIDVFNRGNAPFDFSAAPSADWIRVSKTEGAVEVGERLQVSIDWKTAPVGRSEGSIKIEGTGWGGANIAIDAFQPDRNTRENIHGFVEADGHIAIEAANFSRSGKADSGTGWEEIEQHGRTQSSISVFPVGDRRYEKITDAPWVEYDLYLFSEGPIRIEGIFAPSLDFAPDRGLRYAVSIDGGEPQVIDILQDDSKSAWAEAVRNGVRRADSEHTIEKAGPHKLRIYALDPGITLQKLIVDTGGLRQSYLGPPQSRHIAR
ncbi:glycosyl hydrolase 115 family protein [Microbulbifer halophilus]|uniref:Glycosyl hydrolase 115 family protein n=1 Tax=Microbulbifer halophilus TaxID=453963 RepID=A0ABW5EAE3_9GAMM|nr:glycosyl hydrolase 115 family protein [Microbulbifer halophilus]MCW8125866.1 glycosyl hydrolase 115 family protein [Microbulbifer halophilus]